MCEAGNLRMQLRRNWRNAEPLKRVHPSVRKAAQAIPVLHHAFPLHIIEHLPHLLGRKFMVIQERDKASDSPLKVDVVLPQRVVGVDEKRLGLMFVFGRTGQMCGAPCRSWKLSKPNPPWPQAQ